MMLRLRGWTVVGAILLLVGGCGKVAPQRGGGSESASTGVALDQCPNVAAPTAERRASIETGASTYAGELSRDLVLEAAGVANGDGLAIVSWTDLAGDFQTALVLTQLSEKLNNTPSPRISPEHPAEAEFMTPVTGIGQVAALDLKTSACWVMGVIADDAAADIVVSISDRDGVLLGEPLTISPKQSGFFPLPVGSLVKVESDGETLFEIEPK